MKKNWILITLSLIASVFFMSSCQDNSQEATFNRFANTKDDYSVLLIGHVDYQGQRVSFNLLPTVSKPIYRLDGITVTNSNGVFVNFVRLSVHNNIPAPFGEKEMTNWMPLSIGGFPQSFSGSKTLTKKDVGKFFKIFRNVVKNGKISYKKAANYDVLRKYFQYDVGKSPKKASKMAKKALGKPMFKW